ncbi:hypothetical protein BGX23_007812 [Mortierella sp. AD031]|nr:hypothetical protein BGX23_007812 [Mortierella sp. AD031]
MADNSLAAMTDNNNNNDSNIQCGLDQLLGLIETQDKAPETLNQQMATVTQDVDNLTLRLDALTQQTDNNTLSLKEVGQMVATLADIVGNLIRKDQLQDQPRPQELEPEGELECKTEKIYMPDKRAIETEYGVAEVKVGIFHDDGLDLLLDQIVGFYPQLPPATIRRLAHRRINYSSLPKTFELLWNKWFTSDPEEGRPSVWSLEAHAAKWRKAMPSLWDRTMVAQAAFKTEVDRVSRAGSLSAYYKFLQNVSQVRVKRNKGKALAK